MNSAYESLRSELEKTGVISREFKSLILAWAHKIAEEAFSLGKKEVRVVKRFEPSLAGIEVRDVREARKVIAALRQDISDMHRSPQTVFVRCSGCNRLHSKGWMCPTNGCEEGR